MKFFLNKVLFKIVVPLGWYHLDSNVLQNETNVCVVHNLLLVWWWSRLWTVATNGCIQYRIPELNAPSLLKYGQLFALHWFHTKHRFLDHKVALYENSFPSTSVCYVFTRQFK
jgi:hypothetical protein